MIYVIYFHVFPHLVTHRTVRVRRGGCLGWGTPIAGVYSVISDVWSDRIVVALGTRKDLDGGAPGTADRGLTEFYPFSGRKEEGRMWDPVDIEI